MSKNETPDVALPFSDVWRQMEFEIERLRAENNKLASAYKNGYHDALEAAAELAFKILTEIEGIDFEVPAKIRELHAVALKDGG